MTVRRMSDSVVTQLCLRYGVTIKRVGEGQVPERYRGPEGQGCIPGKRLVYVEDSPWLEIEHVLHELVHVIVQPPWWSIMKTPEEIVLFQFERALADACFEDWAYERVVEWQHQTGVTISGRYPGDLCLGDLQPYEDEPFWKLGYTLCQRIGILDARNRPTYRWPDWSKIEPQKTAIFKYFQSRAASPLPQL